MVFAIVCTEEQAAAIRELMVDLGIDIKKVIAVFLVFGHEGFGQQVDVRTAGGNVERSPVLYDRSLEIDFAGQKPHADHSVIVLHVAIVGAHIDNGREASAKAGGEGAFEKCHFLHGFRCKDGEEAQ